jgi:hypothetical protein
MTEGYLLESWLWLEKSASGLACFPAIIRELPICRSIEEQLQDV